MNPFMFNMGMGNPNMGVQGGFQNFNNMNMNMNMNTMGMNNDDDEWLKGFQMGVDEVNNLGSGFDDGNTPGPKMNLVFTTTVGATRNMKFNHGRTLSYVIQKYLDSVGKPELFGQNDKINFLYNANKLNVNDTTPIERKFVNVIMPKIVVNDTQGLIGA